MYYYSSCKDGHVELFADVKKQSHLKYGPSVSVKIEVIPHYFTHNLWPWFLIVLGGVSYTSMQECVQSVAKVLAIWGVF